MLSERTHREITDEEIERIAKTYHAWRGENEAGKYDDIAGYCKSATHDDVTGHGFVLTPGHFVGAAEEEDNGKPFEEKLNRLATTLNEHFAESSRLDKIIHGNLRQVGL